MAKNKLHWRTLLTEALDVWGEDAQIGTAIEEMGELIQVVNKHFIRDKNNLDDLAEETADVQLCLDQIRILLEAHDKHEWFSVENLYLKKKNAPPITGFIIMGRLGKFISLLYEYFHLGDLELTNEVMCMWREINAYCLFLENYIGGNLVREQYKFKLARVDQRLNKYRKNKDVR